MQCHAFLNGQIGIGAGVESFQETYERVSLEGSPSIPIGSDIFLELLPAAPSSSHNDPTQYSIVSHIRIRHAYYEY